jgi:uncharacterized membrane protein required for colicin V production
MELNIVDIIIILFILLGGVIGFKEGVIKKTTSIVGLILVVVLSFILKNHLSVFFYENLPFLDLWGIFKGIQVLNIIFYEILAFILIASVLMLVYRLLLALTGLIEKILKATIILSIPSKILGFIVGVLEAYIWVYIALFVLTLPLFNIKNIYESTLSMHIVTKTPIVSKYANKTIVIYDDLYNIIENSDNQDNKQLNEETMKLMLEYEIITPKTAKKLINKNKVDVNDDSFIDSYE